MKTALNLAVLLLLLLWSGVAAAEPSEDYRMDHYRAPTPATLEGARVVDSAEAEALWRGGGTVFIDVLPATLGAGLHQGHWLPAQPRRDIPGSLWLPNVGYGVLTPDIDAYWRANLTRLAGQGRTRWLFYCLTDCWMSWNAARRAVSWGRAEVIWYPAGTDGWTERGLPVEEATPQPLN